MAKEKEEKKELSMDNIEEVINNGSTVTAEAAEAAAKQIAEQRKEKLTQRLIDVTLKSEYNRKAIYLSMKKTKKESEIKLNYLKKFSEKDEELRSGKISIEDYEKDCKTLKSDANKLLREVDNWYDEQREKLFNQYPSSRFNYAYGDLTL